MEAVEHTQEVEEPRRAAVRSSTTGVGDRGLKKENGQIMCRHYRFGTCKFRDCRFVHQDCPQQAACQDSTCRLGHPLSWRRNGEEDLSVDTQSSPSSACTHATTRVRTKRRRPPSSSSTHHGAGGDQSHCRYYRRGACTRGDRCPFQHEACHEGMECRDLQCRLGHPSKWVGAFHDAGEEPHDENERMQTHQHHEQQQQQQQHGHSGMHLHQQQLQQQQHHRRSDQDPQHQDQGHEWPDDSSLQPHHHHHHNDDNHAQPHQRNHDPPPLPTCSEERASGWRAHEPPQKRRRRGDNGEVQHVPVDKDIHPKAPDEDDGNHEDSVNSTASHVNDDDDGTLKTVKDEAVNKKHQPLCDLHRFGLCARDDLACAYAHVACPKDAACQDMLCRLGHPREWRVRPRSTPTGGCAAVEAVCNGANGAAGAGAAGDYGGGGGGAATAAAADGGGGGVNDGGGGGAAEAGKVASLCRFYRFGDCAKGLRCRHIHAECVAGAQCIDSKCILGHPSAWRCRGCHRCNRGVTGAGVLLVTAAREVDGGYDLVLAEEPIGHGGSYMYGDMGGKVDEHDAGDLTSVACRELLEETAGTIDLPPATVAASPYVEIGWYHKYRCYIVLVKNLSCRDYDKARENPDLPGAMRETTGMHRFPVAPFVTELASALQQAEDVKASGRAWLPHIRSHSGRPYYLASRCRSVLAEAYRLGLLMPYYQHQVIEGVMCGPT